MNAYKNIAHAGDNPAFPLGEDTDFQAETQRLEALLRFYQRETDRMLGRHVFSEGVLRARFQFPRARSQAVIRVCD